MRLPRSEPAAALVPACRRGLGLGAPSGGGGGRAVTAFAFGPPEGWQRFGVYFLTADGGVWSLCPVVPFGEHRPCQSCPPPSCKGRRVHGGRVAEACGCAPAQPCKVRCAYPCFLRAQLLAHAGVMRGCLPAGCRYPAAAVEQLAPACDAGASPNDEAWLQRAFAHLATPPQPAFASGEA